jgi:23S rRNA (guanosine2251-2'-O)-methyltransferase
MRGSALATGSRCLCFSFCHLRAATFRPIATAASSRTTWKGSRKVTVLRDFQSSSYSSLLSLDTPLRTKLLNTNLKSLDIDADSLRQSALQSIEDPTRGYDGRYGKSAIKTYRSFIYPKDKGGPELDAVQLQAAAERTSRHIQFLLARHRSHQAEWIRHHDASSTQQEPRPTSFPILMLLDNVRSAQNVGSLFRTADAVGVEQVITCGITPHPHGSGADKLQKSALGADATVSSCHFDTTRQGIEYVRRHQPDYVVIGMETTQQSVPYTEHDFCSHKGVCIVLGNEVTGIDTDLLSLMDVIVEIPMFGVKNSLNIAACAPVVLYEIIRQRNKKAT